MKSIALVFTFVVLINFFLTESFEIRRSLDSNNENNDNSLMPVILNDDEDMSVINKRSKGKGKQTDSNSKDNSNSKKDKKKKRKHLRRRKESYEDRMLRVLAKAIKNLASGIAKLTLDVQMRLNGALTNSSSKTINSTSITAKPTNKRQ
uniref:Uncharacterized protein n=1 Tax=Strongyloides papillosus TaxID=174720 RepID=A0A0N5BQI1_STREA